jgi:membrane-bound metal-dependent hydrolase YbcI (DUF457 family)
VPVQVPSARRGDPVRDRRRIAGVPCWGTAMMARAHVLTGLLAGCGIVALVPSAPAPVRVLAVATAGGAALLADLDTPSSTAARSLGPVTRLLARGIGLACLAVYHATRTEADPASRQDGHRLATHTVPGCLLAASLAAAACLLHPAAGAAVLGLLGGLLGLGLRLAAAGLAVGTGALGWWTLTTHPGWWPLVAAAVLAGTLAHLAGDALTPAGLPLAWPLVTRGRRWHPVTAPVTFPAGGAEEALLVTPALLVATVAAGGAVAGVWPLLAAAWPA